MLPFNYVLNISILNIHYWWCHQLRNMYVVRLRYFDIYILMLFVAINASRATQVCMWTECSFLVCKPTPNSRIVPELAIAHRHNCCASSDVMLLNCVRDCKALHSEKIWNGIVENRMFRCLCKMVTLNAKQSLLTHVELNECKERDASAVWRKEAVVSRTKTERSAASADAAGTRVSRCCLRRFRR